MKCILQQIMKKNIILSEVKLLNVVWKILLPEKR